MMKTILLGLSLTHKFWSDALLHVVYLKNRLPHSSLPKNITPYQAWTNQRPDLSHIRTFGSLIYVKKPGVKDGKLDTSLVTKGIFLGFTPTVWNAIYYDSGTKETKTVRHYSIDEAHYSSSATKPPYASDLMKPPKYIPEQCNDVSQYIDSADSHAAAATMSDPSVEIIENDLYLTSIANSITASSIVSLKGDHKTLGF